MTTPGTKRIGKEYEEILKTPPEGLKISLVDDDLRNWVIVMDGPADSPYAGGKFTITLKLPAEYPFKPPKVNFKTRIYHPNVTNDDDGSICLGLLKSDLWKPSSKILSVLMAVKQLLAEPLPDDNVEPSIAQVFKDDRNKFNATAKDYVKRHAK